MSQIKVGETIQVNRPRIDRATGVVTESWEPAQVIRVEANQLGVRLRREPAVLMMVPRGMVGRQWRRR